MSRMSPGQKILRIRGPGAAAVRPAPSFLLIRGIHRRPPGSQANRGMIGTRRGLKFIPDEGPSGGGSYAAVRGRRPLRGGPPSPPLLDPAPGPQLPDALPLPPHRAPIDQRQAPRTAPLAPVPSGAGLPAGMTAQSEGEILRHLKAQHTGTLVHKPIASGPKHSLKLLRPKSQAQSAHTRVPGRPHLRALLLSHPLPQIRAQVPCRGHGRLARPHRCVSALRRAGGGACHGMPHPFDKKQPQGTGRRASRRRAEAGARCWVGGGRVRGRPRGRNRGVPCGGTR